MLLFLSIETREAEPKAAVIKDDDDYNNEKCEFQTTCFIAICHFNNHRKCRKSKGYGNETLARNELIETIEQLKRVAWN